MSKVGRNELCPCGSGKKYKRCCLDVESGQKISEEDYVFSQEDLDGPASVNVHFVLNDITVESALDRLMPLVHSEVKEDLLRQLGAYGRGENSEVSFPWIEGTGELEFDLDFSVFGFVSVRPGVLILEDSYESFVSSAQETLSQLLGKHVVFDRLEYTTFEEAYDISEEEEDEAWEEALRINSKDTSV